MGTSPSGNAARYACNPWQANRPLSLSLIILGLAGFTWVTLHWSYSEGERAGYVHETVSAKGWLCKTWEGEMAMVTMRAPSPRSRLQPCPTRDRRQTQRQRRQAHGAALRAAQVDSKLLLRHTEYFVTEVRVTE